MGIPGDSYIPKLPHTQITPSGKSTQMAYIPNLPQIAFLMSKLAVSSTGYPFSIKYENLGYWLSFCSSDEPLGGVVRELHRK